MRLLALVAGSALLLVASPMVERAEENLSGGDPASGRAFALRTCIPCHVVSPDQASPRRLARAPAFEAIANTPAMTANALHAFLATPHPTMPNLILSPQETADVITYILSLRNRDRS